MLRRSSNIVNKPSFLSPITSVNKQNFKHLSLNTVSEMSRQLNITSDRKIIEEKVNVLIGRGTEAAMISKDRWSYI